MSGTNKLLWSSDIFPGRTTATPTGAPGQHSGAAPADPASEQAYLRYAGPVLGLLARLPGGIRRDPLAMELAGQVKNFDIEDMQRALAVLRQRGMVMVAERDRLQGNDLYQPSAVGRAIGAD